MRTENDNKNQKLIKKEWIWELVEVVVKEPEINILEKMKIAGEKYKEVVKEMKKAEFKMLMSDEWQTDGELVLKRESIYTKK